MWLERVSGNSSETEVSGEQAGSAIPRNVASRLA